MQSNISSVIRLDAADNVVIARQSLAAKTARGLAAFTAGMLRPYSLHKT